jgi:hypothetical protein
MSRLAVRAAAAALALATAVAAVAGAVAQAARERLDGFQEMRFGMSLDQVRQTLGANGRASNNKKSQDGRTLATLVAKASFEGQSLVATYVFGNGDRLALVRLFPSNLLMNPDAAACTAWGNQTVAALTKKYGAPDTTRGGTGNRSTIYRFKDGNEITVAARMSTISCVADIQFVTPEARDGKY